MKLNKVTLPLLIAGLATASYVQVDKAYASEIDGLTGYFTFDNNTVKNEITGKTYRNTLPFGEGEDGTGLSYKGNSISKLSVPIADLGINESTESLTISYSFKWDGKDTVYPFSFYNGNYKLILNKANNTFGFQTGSGNFYGMKNPIVIGENTHITVVMHTGDFTKNEIYINGERQVLSIQSLFYDDTEKTQFKMSLDFRGFNSYSIIDNLIIFNKSLTEKEIKTIYSSDENSSPSNSPKDDTDYDDNNRDKENYTVKVIGTFETTTLDVKVPATSSFLYNPNTQKMIAQKMGIANDTNAPVSMNLTKIEIADTSLWQPSLVTPNRYTENEWRNLTQAQSKAEVALGLKVNDDDWLRGIDNNDIWRVDVSHNQLGVIKTHSSIEAEPILKAGTSLSTQEILTANYVFEFGLAE